MAPSFTPTPQHVAIIMDGNRRFGEHTYHDPYKGHEAGAHAAEEIIRECVRMRIPYLTLYAFSTENWKRSRKEVGYLMNLFRTFFTEKGSELIREGVRIRFIGRRDRLPKDVRGAMTLLEMRSKNGTKLTLTVALDYGGRDEIVRAAGRLLLKALTLRANPFALTQEAFAACLDTADLPDADLIIRTGGEQRLSGFLLWQSEYAELYFTETPWPAFDRDAFFEALSAFHVRERRRGGDAPALSKETLVA
jgi:undecaprenyl diphosphate synthase